MESERKVRIPGGTLSLPPEWAQVGPLRFSRSAPTLRASLSMNASTGRQFALTIQAYRDARSPQDFVVASREAAGRLVETTVSEPVTPCVLPGHAAVRTAHAAVLPGGQGSEQRWFVASVRPGLLLFISATAPLGLGAQLGRYVDPIIHSLSLEQRNAA